MRRILLLLVLVFGTSSSGLAQAWSGILSTTRAIDWTSAGVVGGIPSGTWTQCGNTIPAGSATATIQNAIDNCTANHYVLLAPGTFTGIGGLTMKTGVVLRGAGANATFLTFNNVNGCGGAFCAIYFSQAASNDNFSDTKMQPGNSNAATWTSGYSQGATSIVLNSIGSSGLTSGQYIMLDVDSDTTTNSGYFVCQAINVCSAEGGGGNYSRMVGGIARWPTQMVQITCNPCTNGSTFTVSPGIYSPNVTAGRNPGAWWPTVSSVMTNAGLENMSLDFSSDGDTRSIEIYAAVNVWIKGCRIIRSNDTQRSIVQVNGSSHVTIQDSYIFEGPSAHSQNYGIEQLVSTNVLILNNIFQQIVVPNLLHATVGGVWAYNYSINNRFDTAMSPFAGGHSGGVMYNLFEGNIGQKVGADNTHGTAVMNTVFRNYFLGIDTGQTNGQNALYSSAFSRYWNYVGNVLGTSGYHNGYQTGNAIYALGEAEGATPDDSTLTYSTSMRWGNYDTVNAAVRFNTGEDGHTAPTYPALSNASQTFPNSFYYSSKPVWFGSLTWPPIGPDVVAGSLPNVGGHANNIPARNCYLNTMSGPSDGSGSVLAFNAASCYPTSSDVTNPTPGSGPTTASVTSVSLTLNWTEGTDDFSDQSALQYEVCKSTSNNITTAAQCDAATVIQTYAHTLAPLAVTSLLPETSYYFNVAVRDEAGNKAPYTPVNAVTGACVPTHLTFTSQPSSATLGSSLGTITVAVKDASENTCPSNTSTVTLAKTGGTCTGMTLNGTASGAAAAGLFTTSNLNLTANTGSCTLTATDGALTSTISNSFTVNGVIVTGTATASISETDVVAGGKTLIATVTGTNFVSGQTTTTDISRIGNFVYGVANNAQVTLTPSVPPIQDDVVLVWGGSGTGASVTPITNGYNQVINDTATTPHFGLWYKRMGASPDTTVVMPASGIANQAAAYGAVVLRGVHTSIFDATTTTVGPTASTNPNPSSVTTATDNAWVIPVCLSTSNDASPGTMTNYTVTGVTGTSGLNVSGTDASTRGAFRVIAVGGTPSDPPIWSAWTTGTWKCATPAIKRIGPFNPFDGVRTAIANGLVSAQNETHSWNTDVTPNIPVGNVTRTANNIVTIVIPAAPTYNITAPETLTWTIPASAVDSATIYTGYPTFTVAADAVCTPHHLFITSQPGSALIGGSLGQVSVQIRDAGNVVCDTATNSITLTKNGSATWGTLNSGSNLTKAASSGVATWTDLSVTVTPGSGSIDAASSGLTGVSTNSITISSPPTSGVGAKGLRPPQQ